MQVIIYLLKYVYTKNGQNRTWFDKFIAKNETMQVFELVYSTLYYTNVAAIDGWRCARHITRLAYSTVSTYVCVHD